MLVEKDKKIKELNIRLETIRKLNKNTQGENPFQDISKIDMSIITETPDEMFIRSSALRDIAGGVNAINSEIEKCLEAKTEEINQMHSQIKIL